ncbi:MAG: GspH/FimT family pseudopilin [Shewanella sp.]
MKTSTGFSLIELIVTLAVMVILIAIAAPSLNENNEQIRANLAIKELQQTLLYARNTAISYGAPITACGLNDQGKCISNWQQGLSFFTDNGVVNQVDGQDKVLHTLGAFNKNDIVKYNRAAIRFQPDGLAYGTNGTLKYCPGSASSQYSQALIVNQAGRVRLSTDKNINCS